MADVKKAFVSIFVIALIFDLVSGLTAGAMGSQIPLAGPSPVVEKDVSGKTVETGLKIVAAGDAAIDSPQVASGQVIATGRVRGIRVIVVDDGGDVIQIWSNSDEPERLEAHLGSRTGQKTAITQSLRAAYDRAASTILAGARGLVYQR